MSIPCKYANGDIMYNTDQALVLSVFLSCKYTHFVLSNKGLNASCVFSGFCNSPTLTKVDSVIPLQNQLQNHPLGYNYVT